ncbi:MAG TPA: L,D-transpeptidase [Acidobacteriota bacterium]|nr:L,D-transpeptidase [Acidobacteriota bacterium]
MPLSASSHRVPPRIIRRRILITLAGLLLACAATAGCSRNEMTGAGDGEPVIKDAASLKKEIVSLEKKTKALLDRRSRQFPAGPSILVDSAENRIYLVEGEDILASSSCSTGSGLQLTDSSGSRTWTFETPRGHFTVRGKIRNPVWVRPDWSFVEEGTAIPRDREDRIVSDVLGEYAISFGNGYFIHGTLYTRTLGSSVTHGCIRVDDETLEKIYTAVKPGTPIWIY